MVFEQVKKIISMYSNVSEEDIILEANLSEDLEIDSLDAFEIMSEIEDKFDIQLEDEVLDNIMTVQDIVDYLEKNIEE